MVGFGLPSPFLRLGGDTGTVDRVPAASRVGGRVEPRG